MKSGKKRPPAFSDASFSLSHPELKSLFSRIGSRDRLRAVLTVFYERMSNDLLVGFFFDGKNALLTSFIIIITIYILFRFDISSLIY